MTLSPPLALDTSVDRLFEAPQKTSFFLFGPRGTGKTTWLRKNYSPDCFLDLLKASTFNRLLAHPDELQDLIPPAASTVVIDEVQKIPALLDEVHRLIETRKMNFVLSGSSARKLKKKGVNLLAGRALTKSFFPLTALELKGKFNLQDCLKWGTLPGRFIVPAPEEFLESYVSTYLQEEVQSEGLLRNLGAFRRFLEVASFSQAQPVVYSNIAHEAQIERKTIENYFSILEDLLIGSFIPVFSKKAKRELIAKRKFFFFDAGVYNCLRPKGPLDLESEAFGPALETLVFNELRALNSYLGLGFDFFYWRTKDKFEVDLVLYGKQGLFALEIKNSPRTRPGDLEGLKQFKKDYPMAKCFLLNLSRAPAYDSEIQIIPAPLFFEDARKIFKA